LGVKEGEKLLLENFQHGGVVGAVEGGVTARGANFVNNAADCFCAEK